MKVMTPEFDSRIADWLEDDPDKAPSIVLETVVGALPSIPQRRNWRVLLRFNQMPRFSIAAVALLVTAVGVSAWIAGNRGGIGSAPTPAPTAMPTSAPTPEPTAASTRNPAATPGQLTGVSQGLPVPAGTYRVDYPFNAPFVFTVAGGNWDVGRLEHNVLTLDRSSGDHGIGFLALTIPNKVYRDPCHPEGGTVEVASVDDLVTALTSMPGYTPGSVGDVNVNGADGKYFTLDNSIDVTDEACRGGLILATYDRFGTDEPINSNPGSQERFWILEVNGKPVMLQLMTSTTATSDEQSETEQTIESIDFD